MIIYKSWIKKYFSTNFYQNDIIPNFIIQYFINGTIRYCVLLNIIWYKLVLYNVKPFKQLHKPLPCLISETFACKPVKCISNIRRTIHARLLKLE